MGGIERVAIYYLQELAKNDTLDITLLLKENDPKLNIFVKDIPKNIKIIYIKTEEMAKLRHEIASKKDNPLYNLYYQYILYSERKYMKNWLINFNKKNHFDVIIDFDMTLGKYIEHLDGFKMGWIHYTLTGKIKNPKKSKRYGNRLKKYDKIVPICDEMKDELIKFYHIDENKIERLYNPFNPQKLLSRLDEEVSSEDKALMEKSYMVAVSRLVPTKGRADMINIYKNLKNKYNIKEKLYILGDGDIKSQLQAQIDKLGLQDDVLLLGQKENPYIWMKNAKVFLHTSYGEGFGLVFVESMIMGTPVIAYDCPTGPKDILSNGYGILVQTGDKEKFTEVVANFLNQPDEYGKNMIDKFKNEKLSEFESNNVINNLIKIMSERKDENIR